MDDYNLLDDSKPRGNPDRMGLTKNKKNKERNENQAT